MKMINEFFSSFASYVVNTFSGGIPIQVGIANAACRITDKRIYPHTEYGKDYIGYLENEESFND